MTCHYGRFLLRTLITASCALLFIMPVGFAAESNVTLTPGNGGSVKLNDDTSTTQLKVNTNGVSLPKASSGTASHGLCLNASNTVITCPTASGGHVFMTATSNATLTTIAGGLAGNVAVLPLSGYVKTAYATPLSSGSIDLTPTAGSDTTPPYTLLADGTFTAIRGTLHLEQALSLVGTTVTVTAQVYSSPSATATLFPVPGTACTFAPALTGIVAVGTSAQCSLTGLSIPYTAGSTAVLVVTATAAGVSLINTVPITVSVSVGG